MKLVPRLILPAAALAPLRNVSHVQVYTATLSVPNESPANASPGIGFGTVTIDTLLSTMRVQVTFSGLTGTTTASHIHSATAVAGMGTAEVATTTLTFTNLPFGVTSGSYDQTFDMTQASSYDPAFVTANGGTTARAASALFDGIAQGKAYLNIRTTTFGSGEIRGFLTPASSADPKPSALAFLAPAATGGGFILRRRQRYARR